MEKLYRKNCEEMENTNLKRDLMPFKKSSLLTVKSCIKVF